jgi:hypothetical protein
MNLRYVRTSGWNGEPSYNMIRVPPDRIVTMKVHIIHPVCVLRTDELGLLGQTKKRIYYGCVLEECVVGIHCNAELQFFLRLQQHSLEERCSSQTKK